MVARETILEIIEDILLSKKEFQLTGKCRPSIDESAFNKLSSLQDVADFFGLKLVEVGRPECVEANSDLSNFGFYDEKYDVAINFFDKEPYRMKLIDFENTTSDDYDGDDDNGHTCNIRDVLRAYFEAPVALKRATERIDIINETPSPHAGYCDMHDITLNKDTFLYGENRIKEVMYHEMTHAFENTFLHGDFKSEEVNRICPELRDRWSKATQQDYEYQRSKGYTQQNTTEYGDTNPREDFAEMGSVVSSKITKTDYNMSSAYRYKIRDDETGRSRHYTQTVDEIIEANPYRYALMKELISGNTGSVKDKQEFRRNEDAYFEELGF